MKVISLFFSAVIASVVLAAPVTPPTTNGFGSGSNGIPPPWKREAEGKPLTTDGFGSGSNGTPPPWKREAEAKPPTTDGFGSGSNGTPPPW